MDNSTTLTIASTKINQDSEGRFCLNDCHKASGLGGEKRPSKWLVTEQAKGLIAELEVGPNSGSPLHTVKSGLNSERGTYVCKELVYAYAMWINPKFHLMVIQAFDALVQGKTPRPSRNVDTTLPLRRARLAFSAALRFNKQAKELVREIAENSQSKNSCSGGFQPVSTILTSLSICHIKVKVF